MVDYIWEVLVYNCTPYNVVRSHTIRKGRTRKYVKMGGRGVLGQQLRTRVGVVSKTEPLHNHVMTHRLPQSMRIEVCVEKYRVKVGKVVRKYKNS